MMKIQKACFATVAALAMMSSPVLIEGANLRSAPTPQRNLIASTINDVIGFFVPILNFAIQNSMGLLDLATLGLLEDTVELQEIDFGVCTTSASLSYALGDITGLETFQIETFELVPNSDPVFESTGFLGMGATNWNGTWVFKATMDDLSTETSASIAADACDFDFTEFVGGSIRAINPTMNIRINVAGTSPNLFLLGLSVANSIVVEEADISYDSLELNLGGFGQDINFNVDEFLASIFERSLPDLLIPRIVDQLNQDLGGGLPFN